MLAASLAPSIASAQDLELASVSGVKDGARVTGTLRIRAEVAGKREPNELIFDLKGPKSTRHVEKVAPYDFLGDRWDTAKYPDGDYKLTISVVDGKRVTASKTIQFTVDHPGNPAPDAPAVGTLKITRVMGVANNQVLDGKVTIRAEIAGGTPERVEFELTGPKSIKHVERRGPFVFVGNGWDTRKLPDGTYGLKIAAFGTDGSRTESVLRFHLRKPTTGPLPGDGNPSDGPADPPADNPTEQPPPDETDTPPTPPAPADPPRLTGVTGVTNGASLQGEVVIEAKVTGGQPEEVWFEVTGPATVRHVEKAAPYIMGGWKWDTTRLPKGQYTLTVKVANQGTVVASKSVAFQLAASEAPSEPSEPQEPTDPEENDPTPAPVIVLQAGSGFNGPTPQPSATGSGLGADAMAIARWDVVPHRDVSGKFEVGLVAFHVRGIRSVAFSLNGGPWASVDRMSLNSRTKVEEYCATVDTAGLSGLIEVRAIAFPEAGQPRVLEPLKLFANGGGVNCYVSPTGSDQTGDGSPGRPFATIIRGIQAIAAATGSADGGVIYLTPGEHRFGSASKAVPHNRTRWLTIQPAPGVSRSSVRVVSSGSLATAMVRFRNVTIAPTQGPFWYSNGSGSAWVWVDGCEMIGHGRDVEDWCAGSIARRFGTDIVVRDCVNGFHNADLLRNVTFSGIIADAFQNTALVVNGVVSRQGDPLGRAHSDVYQLNGTRDNMILYNVKAVDSIGAQGFFSDSSSRLSNVALVNVEIENLAATSDSDSRRVFQTGAAIEHMLVKECEFRGGSAWRVDNGFTAEDVVMENTVCGDRPPYLPLPWKVAGVTYYPAPGGFD